MTDPHTEEHPGDEHSGDEEAGGQEPDNPADAGEATKAAPTILRQEIEVGAEQLDRRASGLFFSAVSAGLDIGFGPLMVVTVVAISPGESVGRRLLISLVYSIGFLIVILGRSELFTEHTTLAILPLLSGRTTISRVVRLWGLVYAGNLVGVTTFALLVGPLGITLGLFDAAAVTEVSDVLIDDSFWVTVGSGVAAGWMMGLVSWLVTAARDTMGQILIIVLVAGSIAFLEFHHSIAGSVEVLFGVIVSDVPIGQFLTFLFGATLGNAIGGIVLVAGLKYGHISTLDSSDE